MDHLQAPILMFVVLLACVKLLVRYTSSHTLTSPSTQGRSLHDTEMATSAPERSIKRDHLVLQYLLYRKYTAIIFNKILEKLVKCRPIDCPLQYTCDKTKKCEKCDKGLPQKGWWVDDLCTLSPSCGRPVTDATASPPSMLVFPAGPVYTGNRSMHYEQNRLASFCGVDDEHLPPGTRPIRLAGQGFFYWRENRVRCFSCWYEYPDHASHCERERDNILFHVSPSPPSSPLPPFQAPAMRVSMRGAPAMRVSMRGAPASDETHPCDVLDQPVEGQNEGLARPMANSLSHLDLSSPPAAVVVTDIPPSTLLLPPTSLPLPTTLSPPHPIPIPTSLPPPTTLSPTTDILPSSGVTATSPPPAGELDDADRPMTRKESTAAFPTGDTSRSRSSPVRHHHPPGQTRPCTAATHAEKGTSQDGGSVTTPHDIPMATSDVSGEGRSEVRLCRICIVNKATVPVLPCGHMALCVDCAKKAPACPQCVVNRRADN